MASYFDEHDCQPLEDGQMPNHLLHLARFTCSNCPLMDTVIESRCCKERNRVCDKMEEVQVDTCITDHPGFDSICLNEWPLQVAYLGYRQEYGERPGALHELLIDGGYAREWDMEFENLQGGKPAPPASKESVENLTTLHVSPSQAALEMKCPVCLGEYDEEEVIKEMPCKHNFHPKCIIPWLQKTNSCPVCRYELPTDDKDYEELKRQKARQKQREHELETLHNSMFG